MKWVRKKVICEKTSPRKLLTLRGSLNSSNKMSFYHLLIQKTQQTDQEIVLRTLDFFISKKSRGKDLFMRATLQFFN